MKTCKEIHKERVSHRVGHLENSFLTEQRLYLITGNYITLFQCLDCKVFTCEQINIIKTQFKIVLLYLYGFFFDILPYVIRLLTGILIL